MEDLRNFSPLKNVAKIIYSSSKIGKADDTQVQQINLKIKSLRNLGCLKTILDPEHSSSAFNKHVRCKNA